MNWLIKNKSLKGGYLTSLALLAHIGNELYHRQMPTQIELAAGATALYALLGGIHKLFRLSREQLIAMIVRVVRESKNI
jgi:hypothetical protein